VAERCDCVVVEGPARAGGVAGRVESLGDVAVGEVGEIAGQLDGGRVGAAKLGDAHAPGNRDQVDAGTW
jgi:hypothetical protein